MKEYVLTDNHKQQVADLAVRGMQAGRYFVCSPDFASNLAIASMAGTSPRVFPLILEVLLAPVYVIIHYALGWSLDARIRRWRRCEAGGKDGAANGAAGP